MTTRGIKKEKKISEGRKLIIFPCGASNTEPPVQMAHQLEERNPYPLSWQPKCVISREKLANSSKVPRQQQKHSETITCERNTTIYWIDMKRSKINHALANAHLCLDRIQRENVCNRLLDLGPVCWLLKMSLSNMSFALRCFAKQHYLAILLY